MIEKVFRKFTLWFETGDLIPLLILVSVPHYAFVLAKYDFWLVAAVLGLLVDIGHYRTIKSALRDKGWTWMVILTILSFAFHCGFYALVGSGAWAVPLGAAVPTVIFALAWISKTERIGEKLTRQVGDKVTTVAPDVAPMAQKVTRATRLNDICRVNVSRNGDGPMTAHEIVAKYGVSLRQAQRDVASIAVDKDAHV